MKNKDVCLDFLNKEISRTQNLFIEAKIKGGYKGNILYSYGYHFPLCILLNDNTILINENSYSQTTAVHKGHLCRCLGFKDFKDLEKNKTDDILIFNTEDLKKILDADISTLQELIQSKI